MILNISAQSHNSLVVMKTKKLDLSSEESGNIPKLAELVETSQKINLWKFGWIPMNKTDFRANSFVFYEFTKKGRFRAKSVILSYLAKLHEKSTKLETWHKWTK